MLHDLLARHAQEAAGASGVVGVAHVERTVKDWNDFIAARPRIENVLLRKCDLPVSCVLAQLIAAAREFGIRFCEQVDRVPNFLCRPLDCQIVTGSDDAGTVERKDVGDRQEAFIYAKLRLVSRDEKVAVGTRRQFAPAGFLGIMPI